MKSALAKIPQQMADTMHVKAGYAVAGGLGTTPIWVSQLTDWLQLIAVIVGIAVGLSTFYVNKKKIKYYEENGKVDD